jgi:protein-disulfide isomerase
MVLCLLALPVFAILGIFSLKYRKLTKDALECLFKTVTLRKCESGLDDRIRSSISGIFLKFSPSLSRFFYRYYKIISFLILALFIWSMVVSGIGVYNYIQYGNCNGPSSVGFCIFDPTGENSKVSECKTPAQGVDTHTQIVYPTVQADDPFIGSPNATLTIIEFGCYVCPYTKKAEPIVQEVLDYYKGKVNLQYKSFLLPNHNMSMQSSLAAYCALEQGKYLEYHNLLFANQENLAEDSLFQFASELDMNASQFNYCMATEKYKNKVEEVSLAGIHAGVYGTPTFFVNNQMIVGPKPFKTFKNVIDEELKKAQS